MYIYINYKNHIKNNNKDRLQFLEAITLKYKKKTTTNKIAKKYKTNKQKSIPKV